MRWNKRPKKQEPSAGDLRDREGFLFFPKTINRQTRWLERASLFSTIAALAAALMTLGAGKIAASVAFFLSAAVHFISYLVIKYEVPKKIWRR